MTNDVVATDVVVRDGSTVSLRRADDRDAGPVLEFLTSLSSESFYYRFMGLGALDESRVRMLLYGPHTSATSIVAEAGGRIVALAGFYPDPRARERAEVAFAVSDALQGHGIGTRMLEYLAGLAREAGVEIFDAYVLSANRRMLDVFRDSGLSFSTTVERGVFHVVLSLTVTPRFTEQTAARSRVAATASMKAFFEPRTVAVIGASRQRGKIGSELLHNLVASGFRGTIVPVHPTAGEVGGFRAYPRMTAIPVAVDLAVIVVPAEGLSSLVTGSVAERVLREAPCPVLAVGDSGAAHLHAKTRVAQRHRMAPVS